MPKIINRGNFSQITEETDFEFLTALDSYLSFVVPGAQYTKAYKGFQDKKGNFQRWDGTRRILTSRLEFPTGLIPKVQKFYAQQGRDVEMVDSRPPRSPDQKIDISEVLKSINKVPFDYQLDALEAAKENDRGIIKAATGAGKTLIASLIAAEFGKKTIVYVIGTDLLYQFYELFKSIFGDRAGIVGDGNCRIADFNVCSIWSVGQALGMKKGEILLDSEDEEETFNASNKQDILKLLAEAKTHIVDECHMSACETIQQIYKHINSCERIYGLSGSPWRDDNADLLVEGLLGRYIIDIPASLLIERGFLAKPIIHFMNVPTYAGEITNNYKAVYNAYIARNEVRNDMVVRATKMLTQQGYTTLVLFNNINHGKILYEMLKEEVPTVLLSGDDPIEEREAAKKQLTEGTKKVLVASRIADIGWDCPVLSGLVLAGGGKSTVRAIQRIGRVIRKYPGKTVAGVVDFIDNVKFLDKHSKIRHKIYTSEPGFEVHWPTKKKKRSR